MRRIACVVLCAASALLALGCLFEWMARDVRAAAPPLSLEGLMDEKLPEAPAVEVKIDVGNGPCYVCHGNYDGESLVTTHAQGGVGCIDCHGISYDHRDDEDNITPPDKMYALEAVDKMCGGCHKSHDAPAAKVIARWQERCPGKTDPEKLVCTDCHFQHRLKLRTVVWDKKTGKLVNREKDEPTNPSAERPSAAQ
jgi:hypothetical protein